jgi:glycosyltransferase involved in cell wall biosynthesis
MKLAETLGVSHACKFLGWVSGTEKEALLNSCSVLCLPSRNEAMPISILEGMAHGLVVIATGVGAVPEVIDDNKNGFIIPIGDSDRLAKAIIELFQNPVYLATIAQTSYKTAFENFNVNKTIHTLVTLYHGLAAKLE